MDNTSNGHAIEQKMVTYHCPGQLWIRMDGKRKQTASFTYAGMASFSWSQLLRWIGVVVCYEHIELLWAIHSVWLAAKCIRRLTSNHAVAGLIFSKGHLHMISRNNGETGGSVPFWSWLSIILMNISVDILDCLVATSEQICCTFLAGIQANSWLIAVGINIKHTRCALQNNILHKFFHFLWD